MKDWHNRLLSVYHAPYRLGWDDLLIGDEPVKIPNINNEGGNHDEEEKEAEEAESRKGNLGY